MKALTKTTNCTFRAKKVKGTSKKNFLALCAGSVPSFLRRTSAPPLFKFVPAPLGLYDQVVQCNMPDTCASAWCIRYDGAETAECSKQLNHAAVHAVVCCAQRPAGISLARTPARVIRYRRLRLPIARSQTLFIAVVQTFNRTCSISPDLWRASTPHSPCRNPVDI